MFSRIRCLVARPLALVVLTTSALGQAACGDDEGGSSSSGSGGAGTSTSTSGPGASNSSATSSGDASSGSGTGGGGAATSSGSGGEGGATTGPGGAGGTSGTGGGGTGGSAQGCQLAEAPTCTTMDMPPEAPLVTGTVGVLPEVSGGGDIPPGTFVLVAQIVAEGGTPNVVRIAVFGDGSGCFTAIEMQEGEAELRLSGTSSAEGEIATTHFTCPIDLTVTPVFEVLEPVDGKVRYATLNGGDYREWLEL